MYIYLLLKIVSIIYFWLVLHRCRRRRQ